MIADLRVDIVRFVDDRFPGFVECLFTDAYGRDHLLIEKVPMLTEKVLWVDSQYPQSGHLRCQILSRSKNIAGEALVGITIALPDGLETLDGVSEFTIFESQLCRFPLDCSIFDSAVYRNPDAEWLFPQEKAAIHDLQMSTIESKML